MRPKTLKLVVTFHTTGISSRNWVNAKLIAFSIPSKELGSGHPIM